MKWVEGEIEGVFVRAVSRYEDERGWLAEVFRSDEVEHDIMPVMTYVSVTLCGVTRGPHEHTEQTDYFGFLGPGSFRVCLWDHREDSATRGKMMTINAGEDSPKVVVVPPRVVHGYTNISDVSGWVLNCPNKLYAGEGKNQPVDEIRHEDDSETIFMVS